MSDTTTTTPEAVLAAAEAAAAEARAEIERRNTEREAAHAAALSAWRRDLIASHQQTDRDLEAKGSGHYEAMRAAIAAADLQTAYAEWVAWTATRRARQIVRDAATSAEAAAQTGKHILPELRQYEGQGFAVLLDQYAGDAANALGNRWGDEAVGDEPVPGDG